MKKVCSLLLCVIFTLSAFCSCSGGDDVVMTVGGNDVSYDEYRYFYMNFRADHISAGDEDYTGTIKTEIEDALREKYAIKNLADEKSLTLDSDDYTSVDSAREYYIESYGSEEAFESALSSGFLTDDLFYSLLCSQAIEEKLRDYENNEYTSDFISDDATVEAYIKENFVHATQILILNEAGDDIVANRDLAVELHERALAGEDFDALIREYNEDTDMNGDTVGYYFVEGELLYKFEEAAMQLEVGGISDVVLSEKGYHIIKRLPLDDEYIDDHFEELRDAYKARMFNVMIEERAAQTEIVYTDYYQTLTEEMLIAGQRNVE